MQEMRFMKLSFTPENPIEAMEAQNHNEYQSFPSETKPEDQLKVKSSNSSGDSSSLAGSYDSEVQRKFKGDDEESVSKSEPKDEKPDTKEATKKQSDSSEIESQSLNSSSKLASSFDSEVVKKFNGKEEDEKIIKEKKVSLENQKSNAKKKEPTTESSCSELKESCSS